MTTPTAQEIADQIKALPPPDRLRLAAELLEHGRADTAYLIAKATVDELGAAFAVEALRKRGA